MLYDAAGDRHVVVWSAVVEYPGAGAFGSSLFSNAVLGQLLAGGSGAEVGADDVVLLEDPTGLDPCFTMYPDFALDPFDALGGELLLACRGGICAAPYPAINVFVQRFDAASLAPLGPRSQLTSYGGAGPQPQAGPVRVAHDAASDHWLVAHRVDSAWLPGATIQATLLDGALAVLSSATLSPPPMGYDENDADWPAVAFDPGSGRFRMAWMQVTGDVVATTAVHEHVFDGSGPLVGLPGTLPVSKPKTGIPWSTADRVVDLAAAPARGEHLVVWSGPVGGAGGHDVRAQRLLADGEGLVASPGQLSVGAGGTQALGLDTVPALAGHPYLVLGTLGPAAPGIAVDGWVLPLTHDPYLVLTLTAPNTALHGGTLGTLDGLGRAGATLNLQPGSPPALVGLTAHHAFAAFDPLSLTVVFASEAAPVAFVP